MKNIFLSLVAALAIGSFASPALDATAIKVALGDTNKIELFKLDSLPSVPMSSYAKKMDAPSGEWYVVNIPLRIKARAGKEKEPDFVPAVTVHAYVAFESYDPESGKPKLVMLNKEVTYTDIPVDKKDGMDKVGKPMIGVFISPSSAKKLNEIGRVGDLLKGKLKAVAIEATFNGKNCLDVSDGKAVTSYVIDNKYKTKFSGKWWKSAKAGTAGARLLSVAETPYAPFVGSNYPSVKPLFGSSDSVGNASSDEPASHAAASPTEGRFSAEPAPMDTMEDTATGTTADDTPADTEDTTPARKGRKNKRNRH